MSLVIPTNLMNDAWTNFYRERLLKLRTIVDIGKQTKGLITEEVQDVHVYRDDQPSLRAPDGISSKQIQTGRGKLCHGFWKLDRGQTYSATTQIESQVSISASFKVDTQRRMVKMVLDPTQFQLKLKDLKGRFSDDEILFFQKMANSIWKDFLTSYAEFEIFPTVMDTGNLPIEIQNVSVSGSSVVLDINVLLEGAIK